MLNTDYWWLSLDEARQYKYIDVFHQKPYSDEPNTERDPLSCPMQQSDIRYHLESIDQWRVKFRNINVFRSYALYSSHIKGKEVIGPFLLDIDRFMEQEVGYPPDIDRAIKDTRFLIQKYCSDYKDDDYRIFFTGHKGFHIEIRPEAIGV